MVLTSDQLALVKHIKERNAETRAWIDAAPGRMAGLLAEDAEHWASQGVYTVEQFQHYLAAADHYDAYKSVHGIRPRWMDYHSMTAAEINAETDRMLEADARRRDEILAEERYYVEKLTAELGKDEATLRRWGVI